MSNWERVKLHEVCDKVTVGHVGPMANEYVESGIPFLRSQNIQPFSLDTESIKYITPEFHEKLKKSALSSGDVVIVRTGYPGTTCVIPQNLPDSNCADLVIVKPSTKLNPYYLAMLMNSVWGQGLVSGRLVGVAQQHFNVTVAKELDIPLPSRLVQDKLAQVIYNYNNLIENNLKRIKILEEMAQMVYREWFVNFRFPGHESVKMVDSPLGKIPEGWEVKKLGEVVSIDKGISYKGKFLTDDGLPMVNLKCILAGGGFNRNGTKPYSGEHKDRHTVKPLDIVFANTDLTQAGNIIGSIALVPNQGFEAGGLASHHICIVRRNQDSPIPHFYLYMALSQIEFRDFVRGRASGTTVLGFRAKDADDFQILVPSPSLLDDYDAIAENYVLMAEKLQDKNILLRKTRDLLLPKLISGELDVENLDIRVPEEAN